MLNLLQKRRSIRRYKEKSLNHQDLGQILQAGLLAPSSHNKQPWELVVVQDKAMLKRFCHCREPQQLFLPQAAAAIVVLGDTNKTDIWVEDCSIMLAYMQLQAEWLGIGSCWVQIRNRQSNQQLSADDYIHQILSVPDHYRTLAILALGYPAEEKTSHQLEELPYSKIHLETFDGAAFSILREQV